MNDTVNRLLDLIQDSQPVPAGAAAELASPAHPREQLTALSDVFEGVRRSGPVIGATQEREPHLTVVPVVTKMGVAADLYITTSLEGALDGLRIEAGPDRVSTAAELRRCLELLDPHASVVTHGEVIDTDGRVKAVASLVKVFVLAAVLDAAEKGSVALADRLVVQPGDVGPSSAGLGPAHVGSTLTVAELAQLMVLRSDNTATDMLIDLVGLDVVVDTAIAYGVPPVHARRFARTRDIWGRDISGPGTGGADSAPAHLRGHDYFAPLTSVTAAVHDLARRPWLPWPSTSLVAGRPPVLYKGGSAPGVLSALWHVATEPAGVAVALTVNVDRELGLLEEVYVFSCAEKLIAHLTTEPGAGAPEHRPATRTSERKADVH